MTGRPAAAERGRRAESAVAEHLRRKGFEICDTNYRVHKIGELDLIARREGRLYVIEVKARSGSDDFGGLPGAITRAKLGRMRRTAWCYLKEKGLMNCDVSFLAALVQIDAAGGLAKLSISPIEWL